MLVEGAQHAQCQIRIAPLLRNLHNVSVGRRVRNYTDRRVAPVRIGAFRPPRLGRDTVLQLRFLVMPRRSKDIGWCTSLPEYRSVQSSAFRMLLRPLLPPPPIDCRWQVALLKAATHRRGIPVGDTG